MKHGVGATPYPFTRALTVAGWNKLMSLAVPFLRCWWGWRASLPCGSQLEPGRITMQPIYTRPKKFSGRWSQLTRNRRKFPSRANRRSTFQRLS